MVFNSLQPTIVFQEVPNEISLCFSITGCKIGCKGCHSTDLWSENNGIPLTNQTFKHWLNKYHSFISCVCFFGGEWQAQALIEKLIITKKMGLKTCLYSGQDHIDIQISQHLTFLKTGKWTPHLGGLDSAKTNQRFYNLSTGENLNVLFHSNKNYTFKEKKYAAA
jgi:anaerobic ribonucleoside-triphosphate reductase activating protein